MIINYNMLKFITILYNNEIEICNLFSSIKDHFTKFELIVSLNSKPSYKIFDKRVKYLGNEKNIGFGNAVNRALYMISDEDLVCIVNSDVKFKYVDFKKIYNLLQKNFLIGPACYNKKHERQDTFRKNISLIGIIKRIHQRLLLKNNSSLAYEYSYYKNVQVDWLIGAVMFIKGNHFIKLCGFDRHYFMYLEDSDFCIRAKKLGLKILYSESVICEYEADRKSLKFSNLKSIKLLVYHIYSFIVYSIKHPKIFFKL